LHRERRGQPRREIALGADGAAGDERLEPVELRRGRHVAVEEQAHAGGQMRGRRARVRKGGRGREQCVVRTAWRRGFDCGRDSLLESLRTEDTTQTCVTRSGGATVRAPGGGRREPNQGCESSDAGETNRHSEPPGMFTIRRAELRPAAIGHASNWSVWGQSRISSFQRDALE